MKRIISAALLVGIVLSMIVGFNSASATEDPEKCYDTVHVDATYKDVKVIDVEYVVGVDAVPGDWYNWSPNKDQEPFDGPPAFPVDERGTWQGPHTNGGPDGEGTFQQGNGHGSWFHREAGIPAIPEVEEVSHVESVIDVEAHEEQVEVDCSPVIEPPFDQCPDQSDIQPVGTECPVITPPDPLIETVETSTYNCGDDFQTIHVVRKTTIYDPESGPIAWDILDVVFDEFDVIEPHEVEPCPTTPVALDRDTDQILPNTGAPSIGILLGGALLVTAGAIILYRRH